jgi:hypothetical protein
MNGAARRERQEMKCDDVLDANNPRWRAEARRLMEEKQTFMVVGWKNGQDRNVSTAMALEFDYMYRNFPNESRALFEPKKSKRIGL